jgi:hypothetical protein
MGQVVKKRRTSEIEMRVIPDIPATNQLKNLKSKDSKVNFKVTSNKVTSTVNQELNHLKVREKFDSKLIS